MTDSNSESRLDRIERSLETLTERVGQNAQQIARTQQQVDLNSQTLGELIGLMSRAEAQREQSQQEFQQFRTITQQTLASINAALERIDRVMDYLMRRDGDRTDEE